MPLALTRPSHGICLVPLAQNAPIPSLSSHQKPQPKTAISPRAVPASYTGNIPASHYHTWWLSFWESESDCIYTRSQSSGDPVQVWTKVPSRHRSQQYQLATTPADTVPLTSIRATIQRISLSRLHLISTEPAPPSLNMLPPPTTVPDYPIPLPLHPPSHDIQSFISDLPPASRWPVQHLHFPSPHTILPYSLRDGTVKAVCDGSWKSPIGTAAFLIGRLTKQFRRKECVKELMLYNFVRHSCPQVLPLSTSFTDVTFTCLTNIADSVDITVLLYVTAVVYVTGPIT